MTLHRSASGPARLAAAHGFLDRLPPASEALVVGATRAAVDDFARDGAVRRSATFGLHRFSLRRLAVRIATPRLARSQLARATRLGAEAVAARAAFEEAGQGALAYLAPIAGLRSFGRTLAATLEELRLGGVEADALSACGAVGADLDALSRQYERQLRQARLVDLPDLYRLATEVVAGGDAVDVPLAVPLVLLDVPVHDRAVCGFVAALAARSTRALATVPQGDDRTWAALGRLPNADAARPGGPADPDTPLARVRARLFEPIEPDGETAADPGGGEVSFFSAPGETRECVEIARLVQRQAADGVPFDRMAVVLRAPQVYSGLIETALRRAGVEAWFVRGTRAPDPAGRAFLAVLACAAEQLSARRFAEYLSLGQVPQPDAEGAPPDAPAPWVAPAEADEVLPASALPVQGSLFDVADVDPDRSAPEPAAPPDADDRPVVAGALRAPWRWDRLLVESAVIGGRDRWVRRLTGLERELGLRLDECADDDPRSPRARRLESDLVTLRHLRRFALPVIELLDSFPRTARWGDWLDRLETLAPRVLRRPDRVLATLGELRPMADVGPVPLAEVQDVLAERLADLQAEPPARRYGRVFVGGPEHVRGRVFDVVFVPGLAERMFPQKPRQDPILLDDVRRRLGAPDNPLGLPVADDRAAAERLRLRLAVGAAARRLHLSYSRLELGESRPRVPSFYALDLERARTGRVPDFADTEREAFERAQARLAWPAPPDPAAAIDDTEHDLAVLGRLLRRPMSAASGRARGLPNQDGDARGDSGESTGRAHGLPDQDADARGAGGESTARGLLGQAGDARGDDGGESAARNLPDHDGDTRSDGGGELTGRARYLLDLQPTLRRSLLARWARWKPFWSRYDGVYRPDAEARTALDAHRLSARPWSVTALQRFAACPYQFLLSAVYRLQPREDAAALERLDPLTRGRMFHEAQAELVRGLETRGRLPVTRDRLPEAWALLDETLDALAARYHEELAPAIDRVWTDEIEKLRLDLKGWLQQVADEEGGWTPIRAELGFGFAPGPGRDPRSVADPVRLDGAWQLHGVVDLVEARAEADDLRVTDHKTGRNRTPEGMVVGHGEVLQPVLYGLAVEQALGRPVRESRLFFATAAGGYDTRSVALDETARRYGAEVLSIVDRALETGVILPAPRPRACVWCDYRVVCGPWEETRVRRKDDTKLVDLQALRRLP